MCRGVKEELSSHYSKSESFKNEFDGLLRDYVGRPSPLYLAPRLSERYGCRIYLKREDLNHTGAHKINNTIGQILIAKRMGRDVLLPRPRRDNTVSQRLRFVLL